MKFENFVVSFKIIVNNYHNGIALYILDLLLVFLVVLFVYLFHMRFNSVTFDLWRHISNKRCVSRCGAYLNLSLKQCGAYLRSVLEEMLYLTRGSFFNPKFLLMHFFNSFRRISKGLTLEKSSFLEIICKLELLYIPWAYIISSSSKQLIQVFQKRNFWESACGGLHFKQRCGWNPATLAYGLLSSFSWYFSHR